MKRQITHTLYLDETGDANLLKINQQYPIFGLGGVIIPVEAEKVLDDQLRSVKREIFENEDIILHSTDLRKARRGFEAMLNENAREEFYKKFNEYIMNAEVNFISGFVKKTEHLRKYKSPYEPYEWCVELVLERIAKVMHRESGFCRIVLESRGKREDKAIKDAIIRHLHVGCRYVSASSLRESVSEDIHFQPKNRNGTGLQVSDMMIYPVARAILNNSPTNPAYHVVSKKMDRHHGCRVFPIEYEPTWLAQSYVPHLRAEFEKKYPVRF